MFAWLIQFFADQPFASCWATSDTCSTLQARRIGVRVHCVESPSKLLDPPGEALDSRSVHPPVYQSTCLTSEK